MYITYIMQHYREAKKRDPKKLFYIYCDHSIRKNNKDMLSIEKLVDKKTLHIAKRAASKRHNEQLLRKRRYEKIQSYAHQHKIKILITGHNLSDRIESTILSLLRGAHIDGFLNMQAEEKHSHMFEGTVLRPLLNTPKDTILSRCKEHNIPYSIDTTNHDTSFSKRNKIRHGIIQTLKELSHKYTVDTNTFEESMKNIYHRCDQKHKLRKKTKITAIPRYKIRNSTRAYKRDIKPKNITIEKIKDLSTKLHIGHNLTQKNLYDIHTWIQKKSSGHKYINNTYRFMSHNCVYIIQAEKLFRKKIITDKPRNIADLFEEDIIVSHPPQKRRFAHKGDKIHGKSIKKRCINQKIPIFWRENIIVQENEKNTIKPYILKEMKN